MRYLYLPLSVLYVLTLACLILAQTSLADGRPDRNPIPRSWYVAVDGDDLTGDGSEGNPFATIQRAIDTSSSWDSVLIQPGTYSGDGNRDMDVGTKSLTFSGIKGRDSTLFDCGANGHNWIAVGAATVSFTGLAVQNGWKYPSGGVHCDTGSNVSFSSCLFYDFTGYYGAAIGCWSATATFEDCVFDSCRAGSEIGGGGAVYSNESHVVFTDCLFTQNHVDQASGGAVHLVGGIVDFERCVFDTCGAYSSGGAMYLSNTSAHLDSCEFYGNSVAGYGMAIRSNSSAVTLERCAFHAPGELASISITGGTTELLGCRFDSCFAFEGTGSLVIDSCVFVNTLVASSYYGFNGNMRLANCRVEGSLTGRGDSLSATDCIFIGGTPGGSVFESAADVSQISGCTFDGVQVSIGGTTGFLENSIIAYGTAPTVTTPPITVNCCNIYGNTGGDWTADLAAELGIDGNISSDPRFCDTASGDYTLAANSPCNPDLHECSTLVGALPVACDTIARAWYVSTTGDDVTGDGSDSAPFATIQRAVDTSGFSDSILVEAGTYLGDGNRDIEINTKRLHIVGLDGRDVTIVDCEGSTESWHRAMLIQASAVSLRGLTIQGAYSHSTGALKCYPGSDVSVTSCRFVDNGCMQEGAAAHFSNCIASVDSCIFEDNRADTDYAAGGAVFADSASAAFTDCSFLRNEASNAGGGGLLLHGGDYDLVACFFDTNSAYQGGAIYAYGANIRTEDCTFERNHAGYGSALRLTSCDLDAIDCEFNGILSQADAIDLSGGVVSLVNCVFDSTTGNVISMTSGGELHIDSCDLSSAGSSIISLAGRLMLTNSRFDDVSTFGARADLTNCLFVDGPGSIYGAAFYGSADTMILRNCTFANNASTAAALSGDSVVVEDCIIAYNAASLLVTGTESISCCDIFGNAAGDWVGGLSGSESTGGNIWSDPRFCDTAAGDYSLASNSPCGPDYSLCSALMGALPVDCGRYMRSWHVDTSGNDSSGDGTSANPFATIQRAVDAAAIGDTVLVAPGSYVGEGNRDIRIARKAVVVDGGGVLPSDVTIDAEGGGYDGVLVSETGSDTVVIRNVTVSRAEKGVWCDYDSHVSVDGCVFEANVDGINFSDMFDLQSASVVATGSRFLNNSRYGIVTELAYGRSEDCRVEGCLFEGNATALWGTFLAVNDTIRSGGNGIGGDRAPNGNDHSLVGCVLELITDTVVAVAARSSLTDCIIRDNSGVLATTYTDRNLYISGCEIVNNLGGGIHIDYSGVGEYPSSLFMDDCLYSSNTGGIRFEGIASVPGTLSLENSTIALTGETAVYGHSYSGASINIDNCIVAFNQGVGLDLDGDANVGCCDVYGNSGGSYAVLPDQTGTNGNISEDPLFCDTAAGEFSLYQDSPCLADNNTCNALMGAVDSTCTCCLPPTVGDVDQSGIVDITDISVLIDNQFLTLTPLVCEAEGDLDFSGEVDITDLSILIDNQFLTLTPLPPCP